MVKPFLKKPSLDYREFKNSYADDTQFYIPFSSTDPVETESRRSILKTCVNDIHKWVLHNDLKLNGDKSELLVISSARRPRPTLNSVLLRMTSYQQHHLQKILA